MSNIVDLGVMVNDEMTLVLPNRDKFVLGSGITVEFYLQVEKLEKELEKANETSEQLEILQKLVLMILNSAKGKKVDLDYVKTELSDVILLKVIMEKTMEHINKTINNENLDSPQN